MQFPDLFSLRSLLLLCLLAVHPMTLSASRVVSYMEANAWEWRNSSKIYDIWLSPWDSPTKSPLTLPHHPQQCLATHHPTTSPPWEFKEACQTMRCNSSLKPSEDQHWVSLLATLDVHTALSLFYLYKACQI